VTQGCCELAPLIEAYRGSEDPEPDLMAGLLEAEAYAWRNEGDADSRLPAILDAILDATN
jgi:hypothetical protein